MNNIIRKLTVLGLGRVGLVFSACVASRGFKVYGFDVDEDRVKTVAKGASPFYEPGLDELIKRTVKSGNLVATMDYRQAIKDSDAVFIFVGTPPLPDGSPNLEYVKRASEMIGESIKGLNRHVLVVVRSTVPPGTTEEIVKPIIENTSGKICGKGFNLTMNPEFTREGITIEDTFKPSRIVIGECDKLGGDLLEEFYRRFLGDWNPPIIRTSTYNAEVIKYAANAYLALRVSFINLIARVCEKLPKADVKAVAEGIGLDPRIGSRYLNAGLGFGGSCLPKDVKALVRLLENINEDPSLLKAVLDINEGQIDRVLWLLKKGLERSDLRGVRIAVLGLSFKPGTDDIRESQSIKLVKKLLEHGASLRVHDPMAVENARRVLGSSVDYCSNIYECLHGVDAIIIATEWPEYRELKLEEVKRLVRNPLIIDGRRLLDPQYVKSHGFKYLGIGLTISD